MYQTACVESPRRIVFHRNALPQPAPGEARIHVEGCGVCGSNLPVWQGQPWFNYPMAPGRPGHEGWGVVDAIGDGQTDLKAGDRVAFLGQHSFAEMDLVPFADAVKLPPALDGLPFPGEPLACAINVYRRAGIRSGDRVAVVGAGFLGLLLIQLAAQDGAEVIAISRNAEALKIAESQGAKAGVILTDVRSAADAVLEWSGGSGCATVIECTGFQSPLDLSGEITGVRGRLVIAGYHQDGPRMVNLQQWNWKGLDVINAHERDPAVYRSGLEAAIKAVTDGRLNPQNLYTHTFPLSRLDQAFMAMEQRADGFIKALVSP